MNFRFVDLFAGIGGFHYALEPLGGTCVYASEWDTTAAHAYESNHGIVAWGDITKVDAETIPDHDVLCAGFPCQAFSVAGNQQGFADPRGTLFFDVARITEYHTPKVVYLENVRNFARHDGGKTLQTVRTTLQRLGYRFHGELFNASDFGVPQNRQRYLMVAVREDITTPYTFPTPPRTDVAVEDILEDESDITAALRIDRDDLVLDPSKFLTERVNRPRQIGKVGQGRQGERVYDVKGHGITLSAYGGGIGAKTGMYRMPSGDVRKLTPRECARLQGFPETFTLPATNQASWKLFGNSVPIPMIRAVAEQFVPLVSD